MSKIGKSASSAILIFYHNVNSIRKQCRPRENMGDFRILAQQSSYPKLLLWYICCSVWLENHWLLWYVC